MQQMKFIARRVVSSGLERNHRPSGACRIYKVQRGAEQTGEGLSQGDPFGKGPKNVSVASSSNHLPESSTYSSSPGASIHAQSSTPVPPSLLPFHGRGPQLSASHRPVVNRRCSSLV
jgi:hypothetical protein